jgi:cytochrome oxidase Cu insertion factor (SCO1/SenC/PrrC family)
MGRAPIIFLAGIGSLLLLVFVWSKKPEASTDKIAPVSRPAVENSIGNSNPADDLGHVADFSLTERGGQTIRLQDLRGKVWVASFLFTRCCTGCPRISADLLQLQKDLPEGAVIVSFSVDPKYDTPPVLKAYADTLGADPNRWLFLTGNQDEIYQLIKEGFHLGVEQNQGEARIPGNEVTHSNRLVLVDRQGRILAVDFDGTNPDDLPRLKQRIKELLREKP